MQSWKIGQAKFCSALHHCDVYKTKTALAAENSEIAMIGLPLN